MSSFVLIFTHWVDEEVTFPQHPGFAAGCLLRSREGKTLQGHLINHFQLQVLLIEIFKVAGLLSSTLYTEAHN